MSQNIRMRLRGGQDLVPSATSGYTNIQKGTLLIFSLTLSLLAAVFWTWFTESPTINCPDLVKYNQQCPLVCVDSIDKCPEAVKPTPCLSGEHYCPDGACHKGTTFETACSGIRSGCSCNYGFKYANSSSTTNLLPCKKTISINITLGRNTWSDNANHLDPLGYQCAAYFRVKYNASESPLMLNCNAQSQNSLKFTEIPFLMFYTYLAGQIAIIIHYSKYKEDEQKRLLILEESSKMLLNERESAGYPNALKSENDKKGTVTY